MTSKRERRVLNRDLSKEKIDFNYSLLISQITN